MLAASLLLAGCIQPLAVQDPFMNPFNTTANGIGQRVSGLVAEGRACNRTPHEACPPESAVAPKADPRALVPVEEWESGEPRRPAGGAAPESLQDDRWLNILRSGASEGARRPASHCARGWTA